MGLIQSKLIPENKDAVLRKEQEAIARRKFKNRIKEYNFAYHGPFTKYVEWCQERYEFERIPESCRNGTNFIDE